MQFADVWVKKILDSDYTFRLLTRSVAIRSIAVAALVVSGASQVYAQTTTDYSNLTSYALPSCTANEAGTLAISNVVVDRTCACPGDTVDVSFDYSFFSNTDRYDYRLGLAVPNPADGGNLWVAYQACLHEVTGVTPAPGALFENLDGDNDCGDALGGVPNSILANINITLSCDPFDTGSADNSLTVAPVLDWVQRLGANKDVQFEAPKCKLGDSNSDAAFSIPAAAIISINKISNGDVGSFDYALTNTSTVVAGVCDSSGATGTSGTITTTVDGVSATDSVNHNVADLSQPVVLSETVPSGWNLTGMSCSVGGTVVGSFSGGNYTIPGDTLANGDAVSCTITNEKPAQAALQLDKVVVGGSAAVGDFLLSASGPTAISNVVSGTDTTVDPGTYSLSESSVANYSLSSLACDGGTLVGTDLTLAAGDDVTCTFTNSFASSASFTVAKSTATTDISAPGTISYTITMENTGNVSLTGVTPSDTLPDGTSGTLTGPTTDTGTAGAIDVGETWEYTITYAVTQADIDAGTTLVNTASVTTTETGATPVEDTAETTITQTPSLTVAKTADPLVLNGPGTITYTIVVTNTGNVSLTTPVVTDDLEQAPASALTLSSGPTIVSNGNGDSDLDVGEVWEYTATYVVDQAGIDDGGTITNTFEFATDQATERDDAQTTITQTPLMSFVKGLSATSATTFEHVGDVIDYEFEITNAGNVTLSGLFSVSDDRITGPITCAAGPILVGESLLCTGSYAVTQADIDAGQVFNTANAVDDSGTAPDSPSDTEMVTATQAPELSLVKDLVAPIPVVFTDAAPNNVLSYAFVVTNTGNVTVPSTDTLTISDKIIAAGDISCPAIPAAGLPPIDPDGDGTPDVAVEGVNQLTCTGTYTITSDDVALGSVNNVATANTATTGDSAADDAIFPVNASPALSTVKTATAGLNFTAVGDLITYEYVITNTGGAALAEPITLTDDKNLTIVTTVNGTAASTVVPAGTAFTCWAPTAGSDPTFAPDPAWVDATAGPFNGETATCTATYAVTQADLDAGEVTNEAVAETEYPVAGGTQVTSPPATETVTADATPMLTLDKTVPALAVAEQIVADQVITYQMLATNAGNQTLTGVAISDPKVPVLTCELTNQAGATTAAMQLLTLLPAEILTCTGDYTVTQADIDAQVDLENTAAAVGTTPAGDALRPEDTHAQPVVTGEPLVDLSKALTPDPGTGAAYAAEGDIVSFVMTVQNTGNITLDTATVTDPLTGTDTCVVGPLGPLGTATDTDATCSFDYSVTQADVDAGEFDNTGFVTADPATPGSDPVLADDTITVQGPQKPLN